MHDVIIEERLTPRGEVNYAWLFTREHYADPASVAVDALFALRKTYPFRIYDIVEG